MSFMVYCIAIYFAYVLFCFSLLQIIAHACKKNGLLETGEDGEAVLFNRQPSLCFDVIPDAKKQEC